MLEAVIASGIIVTAVAAALTLVSRSIAAEKAAEDAIVAGNLAREGIEVVRNIRDSNWLAGAAWDGGIAGAAGDTTGVPIFNPATNAWNVDFAPSAITDAEAVVYRYATGAGNAVVGLFVQAASRPSAAVATPFSRLLTLDPICYDGVGGWAVSADGTCGSNEKIGIRVTSRVQWQSPGGPRAVTMDEQLFNWR